MDKRPTMDEIAAEVDAYLADALGEHRHNGHRGREGELLGKMIHLLTGVGADKDGVDTVAADGIATFLHMAENAGVDTDRVIRIGIMHFEAERDDPHEADPDAPAAPSA